MQMYGIGEESEFRATHNLIPSLVPEESEENIQWHLIWCVWFAIQDIYFSLMEGKSMEMTNNGKILGI